MDGCGQHAHDPLSSIAHKGKEGRKLTWAIFIALLFMGLEIIGGVIADSLALLSDALHMFADVGALALGWIVLRISKRPATSRFSFGYKRAEILGALASALSLWVLCGLLIYEAILRLFQPPEVTGAVVFVIAGFGLVANIVMFILLHPERKHSLNMRAAYLHILGDLIGSFGVLVSGAILWMTRWNPIDPIITILFAGSIICGSGKIIRQSVAVLMQCAPKGCDPDAIRKDLLALPSVREIHDLHIWEVASHQPFLSVHIVANNTHKALDGAHALVRHKYHIQHMTIQVEDPVHFDPTFCQDCAPS